MIKGTLPLYIQRNALSTIFKGSNTIVTNNRLIWKGIVTPSPLSKSYQLRIVYEIGLSPKIFVSQPVLFIPSNVKLPHVYSSEKKQLCLFYPDGKEWNSKKLIAKTIIPWACEWLYHYEIWAATGIWNGGGIHYE